MRINGKKIVLRAIEKADLPQLLSWSNDPEIALQLGEIHFPTSQSQQERWFERIDADETNIRLAVVNTNDELLGYTGYWNLNWRARHAEHAVVIGNRDSRGGGCGSDVIRTCAKHAFEQLGLHRLYCNILTSNSGSVACYKRCGFKVEGHLREHQFRNNMRIDQLILGLLAHEFEGH
jgi:RimJ/RimL family protein N-acetyltransferase